MSEFIKSASTIAVALGVAWFGGMVIAEDVEASSKWRIECSGAAEGEGAIQFRVTPNEGSDTNVNVSIPQGRSENDVARDIRDAFQAQLPPARFQIETDDGEDVLVKAKSGTPEFTVVLVDSTVEHVRLHVQRE